ncbi:uncharacterized protein WM277_023030 [Molossus nigricans]
MNPEAEGISQPSAPGTRWDSIRSLQLVPEPTLQPVGVQSCLRQSQTRRPAEPATQHGLHPQQAPVSGGGGERGPYASYRKSSWQAWKSILRADMPGTFDSTSFTQEKQPQRTRSSLCCGLGKSFGSSGSQFSLLLRQYCKENDFMLRQIPECTSGTWQLRMKCLDLRGHISFLSHYCGLSSWLVW